MRANPQPTDVCMPDGRVWLWKGHSYVTNRFGEDVRVWLFEGRCRKCGRTFEMKTAARRPGQRSGAFGVVHCPAHRLPVNRSPSVKPISERIRTRRGQVWVLVDRVWHRTRRGEMLLLGSYRGTCFSCGASFEVKSKLRRRGQAIGRYLKTIRCKQCRERGLAPLV